MKGIYGVLWFLTCLFLTRQLANVLLVRCRPRVLGAAAFLSLLLSYGDSLLLPHVSPPSDANVVLAALPFFIAGYFCRATLLDGWPLATASAVGIAVLFLLIIHGGVRIAYNMRSAVYGVPILTPVLAFCCIFACIFACKLLAQSPAQSF
jgi:fucose 4-O-acetylase-like acetyltransferase